VSHSLAAAEEAREVEEGTLGGVADSLELAPSDLLDTRRRVLMSREVEEGEVVRLERVVDGRHTYTRYQCEGRIMVAGRGGRRQKRSASIVLHHSLFVTA
jgi:hypothetical protein